MTVFKDHSDTGSDRVVCVRKVKSFKLLKSPGTVHLDIPSDVDGDAESSVFTPQLAAIRLIALGVAIDADLVARFLLVASHSNGLDGEETAKLRQMSDHNR